MTVTLDHVDPDLRERVERMLLLSGFRFWVSSAYRSRLEQIKLYALYMVGGATAAKPGSSNHEKGLAVDVACVGDDMKLRASIAKECGLITPVKGEPWHFELDPKRKPLAILPSILEVKKLAGEHVAAIRSTPDGNGYWIAKTDGSVYAFGTAPFFGSMGGKHLNAPIVDMEVHPSGRGYWLVGDDMGVFAFGESKFLTTPDGKKPSDFLL